VYRPFVRFGLSSMVAFLIDLVLVLQFATAFGHLLPAVVLARVCSSSANFLINRHLVFRHGRSVGLGRAASRYFSLVVAVLAANYALLHLLHERFGLPLLPAKLLTEVTLFVVGFQVQRHVVFTRRHPTS
jgi:putative flippase GtrA